MRHQPRPSLVQIMACRRQAIIRTNAGILSIGPLEINLSEILMEVQENAFENVCQMAVTLSRPQCVN